MQLAIHKILDKITSWNKRRKGRIIHSLYIDGSYIKQASLDECKEIYEKVEWNHRKRLELSDKSRECYINID